MAIVNKATAPLNMTYAQAMTNMAFSIQQYKALAETYRAQGRYALMGMANEQAAHLQNCMDEHHAMRHLIRR